MLYDICIEAGLFQYLLQWINVRME